MLKLYHGLASTCSKKVRMCLYEKGLEFESHLLNLQKFEQHDPAYLKLNPNGVVPTLVHDGRPIVESTVIIEYLEDAFPEPPLRPKDPYERAQMRLWTNWSDHAAYAAVYIPTWNKLSRPVASKLSDEELEKMLSRVPTRERRERWRSVAREGFSEKEFEEAYEKMERTFERMEGTLANSPWLAGRVYSLADIAMVPFIERMLELRSEALQPARFPAVQGWLKRMMARSAYEKAFHFQGMDASTSAVKKSLEAPPQ
ncbi:MAG: glutathione S-transferase family protein [Deltaproteobacteria bacterium]|nr:glutathione S-transferase family protein [Deltaproteobacteria bacterium]